jgi:hypothetical protein
MGATIQCLNLAFLIDTEDKSRLRGTDRPGAQSVFELTPHDAQLRALVGAPLFYPHHFVLPPCKSNRE